MTIPTSHDGIFRAALANKQVAKEFIESNLPAEIIRKLDLNYLELCPVTYVDDQLKYAHCDVVLRTRLKEEGHTAYLFSLLEHQSTPDPIMPWRMLKYNVRIWDDHLRQNPTTKKFPLILNLVFYSGQKPYCYSTDFRDLLDASAELVDQVWAKPFTLIQAKDIPDEAMQQHRWAGTLAFFMKHVQRRDFLASFQKAAKVLHWLVTQATGDEYLQALLQYSIEVADITDIQGFIELIKRGISPALGEKAMSLAERLRSEGFDAGMQRGVQQGIQQGVKEGVVQGVQHVARRLLQLGRPLSEVEAVTGLSLAFLQQLQQEVVH